MRDFQSNFRRVEVGMPRTEVFYVGVVNMIAARALAAESVIKMTVRVGSVPIQISWSGYLAHGTQVRIKSMVCGNRTIQDIIYVYMN